MADISYEDEFGELDALADDKTQLFSVPKSNLHLAHQENPDQYANDLKTATNTNIPLQTVQADRDTAAQLDYETEFGELDLIALQEQSPGVARLSENYDISAIIHDDIPFMEQVESAINDIKKPFLNLSETIPKQFKNTFDNLQLKIINSFPDSANFAMRGQWIMPNHSEQRAIRDIVGETKDKRVQASAKLMQDVYQRNIEIDKLTPEDMSLLQQGVRGGVESLSVMIPALAAGVVTGTGTVGVLSVIGSNTFVNSYGEAKQKGLNDNEANVYAGLQATIEVGTEMLPVGTLIDMYKMSNGVGKNVIKFIAQEMGTEQLATAGQSLVDYGAGLDEELLDPNLSFDQKLKVQVNRQIVTAVATMFAGGAQIGAVAGLRKIADRIGSEGQYNDIDGDIEQNKIDNINETSLNAKTRLRSPETFKDFVNELSDQDVIYIDGDSAKNFMQGKKVEGDKVLIKIEEQLLENDSINGDVVMTVGDFAADVVGSEHYDQLRPMMTLSSETVPPIKQESEQLERQEFISQALNKAEEMVQTHQESLDIYNDAQSQLLATGVITPFVAKHLAAVLPEWASTKADRLNINVSEVYNKVGIKITGPENLDSRTKIISQLKDCLG